MEDTWFSRDLPVLDDVVRYMDQHMFGGPSVGDIAERTGLSPDEVGRAVVALNDTFLSLHRVASGGDPSPWFISSVYANARLAVGQWPTPESIVDRLSEGLSRAADAESDPEKRSRIGEVVALLRGAVRDVAVEVAASVVAKHTGA